MNGASHGAPLPDTAARLVFVAFFAVTILAGSTVRWWRRRHPDASHAEEWSLGGRGFGTWVTWFLVGGDFYTAYTVIAVPALVYATGAFGFFALPYTVIVYPFVFLVMPVLWDIARRGGLATAADIVRARFDSRALELAITLSGLAAVMPYIALQLIGIRTVIEALGLPGEASLLVAFASLAVYTWLGGLHAPALTAFIKDIMIYIAVLAAVTIIPLHLGGYGAMLRSAAAHLPAPPPGHALAPGQVVPYATLALSSALAAFLYPHTLTGVLAAQSADTIRRNAVMLPAYTLLLGLIAMLGLMAHAAGIVTTHPSSVVPLLFLSVFPSWFAGFCFAAVAVGALVPAAVMAIGAASLVTRNLMPSLGGGVRASQVSALAIKIGALACVLWLNAQFAIDLQLLGGLWILQTFPALILGLLPWRVSGAAMLVGWAGGTAAGTLLCFADGLKPTHVVGLGAHQVACSTGLLALMLNIALVLVASALPITRLRTRGSAFPNPTR
ncbi:Na+/solute symporter [Ameyamaea chiangmaiensis NBRC 103196]|uniref:Sodium:solute symporter n=1 Tax=Ameyamaea chiangmaiensis TaxID=442969 RepID=A0A850PHS7_9PROT|nr:sodium:solute symporter [Ameyamaea chiangmaiensis]MBS4074434.1 sodium:solute symporter [Ameyamaea chiangmaiensis]NVN40751.1 sodium:solute symporter [Ameyamaea chiangmaiensis]GBQ72024.1 Na+/solute symporter [Ameyamaea chiangmaiensis NBRC 103196]